MPTRRHTSADRAAALGLYDERRERGLSIADICAATGVRRGTLLRWAAEAKAAPKEAKKVGRPPACELTEAEANALRLLRLRSDSLRLAVEDFLSSEVCSPATRDYLERVIERAAATGREPSWPSSLRRAAHVSEEIRAKFRGERAVGKYAPTTTRGAFWIDAEGTERSLMPLDIWESDDMSANEPFRHRDPVTGEELIGRQILFTGDRQSAALLGLTLVGRDRDAYRAEDILDHLLDLIDVYGMPRVWRIERGIWESRGIAGVALDDARARELGYLGERWAGRRMFGGRMLAPNDLLREAPPRRELPASERWRFLPRKQLAVVQRGLISATVEGQRMTWEAAADGIHLDHGHRVVIAWHPQRPELGCTVVEAEFGARNREGRPIGEPLFVSAPLELRPQWDERPAEDRDGGAHPGQRWRGQVRREFRAIQGAAKSHLGDGRGRSATVESGFGLERAATEPGEAPATIRRESAPTPRRSTAPALDAEALAALEEEALKYF
jgi:hypothetical protein